MIHVNKNTRIPSVEETLGTLRYHNSMMPQFADFDKVMMNINYLNLCIDELEGPLFNVIGRPTGVDAGSRMRYWLSTNPHVDSSVFNWGKTGMSLDQDSIQAALDSGRLPEDVTYLLQVFQKYAAYVRMRGTMISLLQNPISDVPSCDGHRMLILKPTWHPQNTGRVAMRDPAIQNFHRQLQEVITVPEGFVYCHTDSGQIEPRVVYSAFVKDPQIQALIRLYNDAYFGVLHYISLDESVHRSGVTTFDKMEITDDMKASRQTIKTNNNAVMYGSKSNTAGDPVKAKLIKYIGEHPLRLEWIAGLENAIARGNRIFYSAFGTPIDISNSKKLSADGLRANSIEDEMLRLAINNPIQATAADLMRLSVYEANKLMMNKAKKSYIINYVHDAGSFAIHQDDYDAIADELGDIVSYDVEGWLPILAEPEFGRHNGEHGLFKDLY